MRQQLFASRANRKIADVDVRQTVALTERTVRNTYWDYVYAINALKVARQTLDLAQESLRNTRSRVEIGTLAPIDVVQAESEVASREEAVILAEASIGQSEDQLRSLIFDPKTPGFFDMRLEPTDVPQMLVQEVDVTAAVDRALKDRTDLIATRKRLEVTDYNVKYFKNQTLPGLDARFDYNSTGLGGTQLIRDPDSPLFPPPVIGEVVRSYGDVLGNVFSSDFPTWRLSLNVTYPIGNSHADASLARTRIEKTQSETSLRQLELNVATQVRDSGRQLVANAKRVEATSAARVLAERRLEAEEKKFAAGMSTSFEVFQAQRDLAQARSTALRAVLDYAQSQVDFETVQIAPIGGGGNFRPAPAPSAPRSAVRPARSRQARDRTAVARSAGSWGVVAPAALRLTPAPCSPAHPRLCYSVAVPKVSVTVITRNEAHRLAEALQSVAWADERIVVDSGSTDDTLAVARQARRPGRDPRLGRLRQSKEPRRVAGVARLDSVARRRRARRRGAGRRDPRAAEVRTGRPRLSRAARDQLSRAVDPVHRLVARLAAAAVRPARRPVDARARARVRAGGRAR